MAASSPVTSVNAEPILPAVGIAYIILGRAAIFHTRSALPGMPVPRQNCYLVTPDTHLRGLEDVTWPGARGK
jgi:hypothetical protein